MMAVASYHQERKYLLRVIVHECSPSLFLLSIQQLKWVLFEIKAKCVKWNTLTPIHTNISHTIVFLRSNTNLLYKTYNVLFANEQKIDSKERGTCQILLRTKTPNDILHFVFNSLQVYRWRRWKKFLTQCYVQKNWM